NRLGSTSITITPTTTTTNPLTSHSSDSHSSKASEENDSLAKKTNNQNIARAIFRDLSTSSIDYHNYLCTTPRSFP
ncbi:hypothetical protein ACLOJK_034348, partial [Asimina triloba]